MSREEKIAEILYQMTEIVRGTNAEQWGASFDELRSELFVDRDNSIYKCRRLFGGMGSLNDVILMSTGIVLVDKNEKLDSLRSSLFQLVH